MAAPDLAGLIQAGLDILNTSVDPKTKKITVQLGDVAHESTDSTGAELWQHYGMVSRVPKPDPGKAAAQALVVRAGDRDLCVSSQDLRGLALYGALDYGEVCLYSAGEDGKGQARFLLKKDGSIHLYTREGNTDQGGGMVIQLDPMNDAIRLLNSKGFGIIIDPDGITITTGAGALTIGEDGAVALVGTGPAQLDGTSILLGSIAAPAVNAVCVGPAGIAAVGSTKVSAALA